jgi:hypothetical protein
MTRVLMITPKTPPLSRRTSLAALCTLPLTLTAHAQPERPNVVLTIMGRGVKRVWADGRPNAAAADVADSATFTLAELAALPQHSVTTPTPWHDGERAYSGPLLRDVLASANAKAQDARFVALNDYRIEIPISDFHEHPVILAIRLEGKPMTIRDKGPLFVMYPFDKRPELRKTVYFSRCVWQLHRIELI